METQSDNYKRTNKLQEVSHRKSKSPRSYAKQIALVTSAEFDNKIKIQQEISRQDGPIQIDEVSVKIAKVSDDEVLVESTVKIEPIV